VTRDGLIRYLLVAEKGDIVHLVGCYLPQPLQTHAGDDGPPRACACTTCATPTRRSS